MIVSTYGALPQIQSYRIKYHIVWIIKYRKLIFRDDIALRVCVVIREICKFLPRFLLTYRLVDWYSVLKGRLLAIGTISLILNSSKDIYVISLIRYPFFKWEFFDFIISIYLAQRDDILIIIYPPPAF